MRVILLVILLAAVPLAQAQSHDHEEAAGMRAVVLRDGPGDGRAVVGGLTHFGFALLDEEGGPVVHRDARIVVTQEGVTLVDTASAHEYDGLFSLDVLFTRPGPYEVHVSSEDFQDGFFSGTAVMPEQSLAATILAESAPRAGSLVDVQLSIVDEEGAIIPHSDAIVEIRRADGRLAMRSHLHIHDEPISFTTRLDPKGGEHTMQVTAFNAFPTGRRADFEALVLQVPLPTPPAAVVPPVPAIPTAEADLLQSRGASASEGGVTLHATYDPQRLVGLGQPIRIGGILVDDAALPLPHVDFELEILGPAGLAFASTSLHEYDAVLELAFVPDLPGEYVGIMRATHMDATLEVPLRFVVAPPAAPLGPGPSQVRAEGIDDLVAGAPADVRFHLLDASGAPIAHSEVDVTVSRPGEPALYQFKMHGHAGVMEASLLFPEEGVWYVLVEPIVLMPQASLVAPVLFKVAAAAPLTDMGSGIEAPLLEKPVPGLGALALLAAGAALATRRRG